MVYISRRETFNSAHKLTNPEWDMEKNLEVFGKCANENWHGHNYILTVTVKGDPDPITGFVVDARELSKIINVYVIDHVDHRNMNLDVSFMKNIQPTVENIAKMIWAQIHPHIKSGELHCVKLQETEKIHVEYFGE